MTRWMRPPELDRQGDVDRLDPAFEGARCGLSREVSLAIWERISADATGGAGRRDEEEVRRQFRERDCSGGGDLGPGEDGGGNLDAEVPEPGVTKLPSTLPTFA
jgi:hypothetical protein